MRPRIHPNGFIQLDLANDTRLHVWPDGEIPRQNTVNTIHDHKFDMTSTVLCGELIQIRYSISPVEWRNVEWRNVVPFTHEIYRVDYMGQDRTRNSILQSTGVLVVPSCHERLVIKPGETYMQHRYSFHDTKWNGLTATLMHKNNTDEDYAPRVLCPIGKSPDNDYDRWRADESLMWKYIDRAMQLAFPFWDGVRDELSH